ncbi:MAG TPA: formate--tetrahydrofolate ligase [Bacillota bacterium]|nr:MAG: Formate--tetrahydrofolate ligase [Firmicutes bacterium ADurb.Bin153]HNV34015.1 formate--tetrahydrofolate ligase [Bacillota bacterium]HPU95370.1 formate--tetrahydrofolate ligase [Bacillota bacterium]
MPIPSDIEIAQATELKPIQEIAASIGIAESDLEYYGKYKAKLPLGLLEKLKDNPDGKLIYTTAITATPAGEGKTCTAIGLTQALGKLGKKVTVALREPSLGPVFGIKGGATGGGYSQVLPMEDINLHFTGDIHAVTAAHNLMVALLDNHIFQGNVLDVDPRRVLVKRVMDMNDRQLRNIVCGLGGVSNGMPRESGFDISVASEVMAILCLASGMEDLKARLGRIIVAYTYDRKPVTAADIKAVGAMAVLLKDALKPNLVQTVEGQPAFIHGGPFANIAHGNNSILATRLALKLADYVVTEGGFASDLGAEKFFDIVHRQTGLRPDVAVLVASVRALNMHGGVPKDKVSETNLEALAKGCENLDAHIDNLKDNFGLPVVVAINKFPTDSQEELELIERRCKERGVRYAVSEVVAKGGAGGGQLAEQVLEALEKDANDFRMLYGLELSAEEKIKTLATKVYGADDVTFSESAKNMLGTIRKIGYGDLPVCVAKTQHSLTDIADVKGRPRGWKLTVKEIRISAGAGFIVAITGEVMTMPGLPKVPAANSIDILEDGTILNLF